MQEFDHTVEIRDPKTGQVVEKNDYILRIGGSGKEYERPPGSGMIFDPTGKLIRDEQKTNREKAAEEAKAQAEAEEKAKKAEAEKIVAEAHKEADELRKQVLADAMAEAEQIKADAKAEFKAVSGSKKGN